ncbi:DUF1214 domain-containing protein, partial [Blastomonas sp.]|uniref:DUF1214 domain-containing protein n=1 Tax=Blastomonas sp. TaxID=1909299 RepID=UPI00359473C0
EREAIYFNASTDSADAPLSGRCRYRVRGQAVAARWWSLTLYDSKGYLIANQADVYSLGSAALSPDEADDWSLVIGRAREGDHWIPVASAEPFELTLRAYHPAPELLAGRGTAQLPVIERLGCAS